MPDPLTFVSTRRTPQTEPDPAVADRQVRNAAGGFAFKLGDDARIHRFLTLGTTGGTYYSSERELTKANAEVVLAAARERGAWLATRAATISQEGRAPRNNPAIFALAAVAGLGDDVARKAAFDLLPLVCRTGTHLFTFATYVEQFRGWGRGLRRAVGNWYLDKDVDALAYQAVKYRQREGWSHADLLRLAHPEAAADDLSRRALFEWIVDGKLDMDHAPGLVQAFVNLQGLPEDCACHDGFRLGGHMGDCPNEITNLIARHPLSWEMLPDADRTSEVWKVLIAKGMPQTALMRQLPTLTRLGVLDDPEVLDIVRMQLCDTERLRKGRVHPVNVLIAQKTYASGHSMRGDSTWTPKRQIIDALDAAFYAAYGTIEPAGKRTLIALDVSGSMTQAISGMPLDCREASAALALVTMATEPSCDIVGFTASASPQRGGYGFGFTNRRSICELPISPRQRLDDAVRAVSNLPFGGTDCALPMLWALEQGRAYDTMIVMTDNETWAGGMHPHQALTQYREATGIPTRLAVVGMTASDVSIADPADPGQLDVAGFDSSVPNLLADFSRGTV